jgi:hypothetical protein
MAPLPATRAPLPNDTRAVPDERGALPNDRAAVPFDTAALPMLAAPVRFDGAAGTNRTAASPLRTGALALHTDARALRTAARTLGTDARTFRRPAPAPVRCSTPLPSGVRSHFTRYVTTWLQSPSPVRVSARTRKEQLVPTGSPSTLVRDCSVGGSDVQVLPPSPLHCHS